jgi:putative ABC transport system substrate-binding protein
MTVERREEIATFTSRARIPSVAHDPSYVGVGGLLAYGPDILERFRQAASMVDKVLRGRRPSELPVDLPGIFDLGVNVRTAAAIGVDVPRSLLLRATHVVE